MGVLLVLSLATAVLLFLSVVVVVMVVVVLCCMSARARTCACMYVWMCAFMRVLVWGSGLEIKQWLIAVAACLDGYAGERVWGTGGR